MLRPGRREHLLQSDNGIPCVGVAVGAVRGGPGLQPSPGRGQQRQPGGARLVCGRRWVGRASLQASNALRCLAESRALTRRLCEPGAGGRGAASVRAARRVSRSSRAPPAGLPALVRRHTLAACSSPQARGSARLWSRAPAASWQRRSRGGESPRCTGAQQQRSTAPSRGGGCRGSTAARACCTARALRVRAALPGEPARPALRALFAAGRWAAAAGRAAGGSGLHPAAVRPNAGEPAAGAGARVCALAGAPRCCYRRRPRRRRRRGARWPSDCRPRRAAGGDAALWRPAGAGHQAAGPQAGAAGAAGTVALQGQPARPCLLACSIFFAGPKLRASHAIQQLEAPRGGGKRALLVFLWPWHRAWTYLTRRRRHATRRRWRSASGCRSSGATSSAPRCNARRNAHRKARGRAARGSALRAFAWGSLVAKPACLVPAHFLGVMCRLAALACTSHLAQPAAPWRSWHSGRSAARATARCTSSSACRWCGRWLLWWSAAAWTAT